MPLLRGSGLLRTWPAQQLLRLPSLMQLPQHILVRAKPGASRVPGGVGGVLAAHGRRAKRAHRVLYFHIVLLCRCIM